MASESRSKRSPSPLRHRSRRSPSPRDKTSKRRHDSRSRSPSKERSRRRYDHKSNSSRRRSSRSPSVSRHRSSRSQYSDSHKSRRRRSSSVSSLNTGSSSSESEYERRKRRDHKKHRKDKKHKKSKKKSKKSKASVGDQWGKYGIIHEADIFTKEAEFQAWLIEVKHANVETLNNNKRKEMFIDFMEDYNTATMPHEKFYHLEQWERRQEALRMGEKPIPTGDSFNFKNDEENLRMQHRQAARASASRQPTLKLSEEQILELTRINRERIEADRMRKMGLKPKESMGVRYEMEEQ